jgi:hypothetical protein
MFAMKHFVYGLFGCITALLLFVIFQTQYSDYRAKAELGKLFFEAEPLQRTLEDAFRKTGKFDASSLPLSKKEGDATPARVFENGTIVLRAPVSGESLVLIPTMENGQVRWACFAGLHKDKPSSCKE